MNSNPLDRITTPQAAVVLINYMLGAGIFTLPRAAVDVVKTPDVWISVIIGGLLAMLAGVIMVKLAQQHPGKTFFQFSQDLVGRWLGRVLSFIAICYFFTISAYELRAMVEVAKLFLLEGTPVWAITMAFMWVSLYLIIGGINPMARLYEIILPITGIIFLLVTLMSFGIFELDNLRPVLGEGIMPVLKGVKTTALTFAGIEIMLILLVFMKNPDKAVKVVLVGTTVPLIFYLFTVVMVIGGLSVDGVITRAWPTLDLVRSFEIKGLIFERFESLLLVIWIMQIFSTCSLTHYTAALGLAQLFKKKIQPFMFGLVPVIFIISMFPKNILDLFTLGDMVSNAGLYLFGCMPLLLLMLSRWKKGKFGA
ncbi:GerAB/ArcD/ProY family transporter [Paenibacillus sp. LMG 31456]|uniref:GerAB/ArcD/ProY family transporter n=1 Tax=Paenibacillus foliorum TaxID=2654974 RepID=A0A972JYL5_9BACL|nr:spore germination protein [Paenibacillus foliorum]NOU92676.1 GerAB/ArcD/ProY family transporter [Paenibacillus foliorum]